MKILVQGAVIAAALVFAVTAQAGPGNDGGYGRPGGSTHSYVAEGPGGSGYPQQGSAVGSRAQKGPGSNVPYAAEGPGNNTPYTARYRHHRARWRHARLSAHDRMADQLNRMELDRLRAGGLPTQPPAGTGPRGQMLHCYNPSNPDCD